MLAVNFLPCWWGEWKQHLGQFGESEDTSVSLHSRPGEHGSVVSVDEGQSESVMAVVDCQPDRIYTRGQDSGCAFEGLYRLGPLKWVAPSQELGSWAEWKWESEWAPVFIILCSLTGGRDMAGCLKLVWPRLPHHDRLSPPTSPLNCFSR